MVAHRYHFLVILCHQKAAMRPYMLALLLILSGCGPRLPAPNSAETHYDEPDRAVQVLVSGLQPRLL